MHPFYANHYHFFLLEQYETLDSLYTAGNYYKVIDISKFQFIIK